MTPVAWLTPEIVEDLGWALVHFLWQGLALALVLRVILAICRNAVARYNWSLATLIVMLLSPVATFLILHRHTDVSAAPLPRIMMDAVAIEPGIGSPAWAHWLVAIWSSGIIVLSLRALGGWYLTERLRRRGTFQLPASLVESFQNLQRRIAIARPVLFLQSALVAAPAVVGWLRPVVLIPASALAGLTPRQLEAVIVHELAHVKRLDALANLLQIVVETLLFYHPAVWWVSRRVRAERENCCDDIAVAICDDAVDYAKALTFLETWRSMPTPALAATGGELKQRVLRLLGRRTKIANVSLSAFVAAALFLLFGGLAAQSAIGEIAAAVKAPSSAVIPVADTDTKGTLQKQIDAAEDRLREAERKKGEFDAHAKDLPSNGASLAKTHDKLERAYIEAKQAYLDLLSQQGRYDVGPRTNAKASGDISVIENPKPISRPPPTYPTRAEQREIEGYVDIDFMIQPDGSVGEPKVKAEVPESFGFADAAMAVFPKWKFDPNDLGGRPLPAAARYRFNFKLSKPPSSPAAAPGSEPSQTAPGDKRRSDTGDEEKAALQKRIDIQEEFLREAEHKKAEFLTRYYDLLPTGDAGTSHLIEARSTVHQVQEDLDRAIAKRDDLVRELDGLSPYLTVGDVRLAQLREQLDTHLAIKLENNPDIVALRHQIEALTTAIRDKAPAALALTTPKSENPTYRDTKKDLGDVGTKIAFLRRQLISAETNRDKLEDEARKAPAVGAEYLKLDRDYAEAKRHYEDLLRERDQTH